MHKKRSKTSWTKNVSCVYKVFQFLLPGSGWSCVFSVVLILLRHPANLDLPLLFSGRLPTFWIDIFILIFYIGIDQHIDIDRGSQSLLPLRCHNQFRSRNALHQLDWNLKQIKLRLNAYCSHSNRKGYCYSKYLRKKHRSARLKEAIGYQKCSLFNILTSKRSVGAPRQRHY